MKLTDEDKIGMTADEIQALESGELDAADARQNEDLNAAGSAQASASSAQETDDAGTTPAEHQAEAGEGGEGAAADDLSLEALASVAAEGKAAAAYDLPNSDDLAAKRKEFREKKRDIEQRWSTGELTDEERATQLEAVEDSYEALIAEAARAATLRDINEQNAKREREAAEAAMQAATVAIIKQAAQDKTIDYVKDTAAQTQFDVFLNAIDADPANAGKSASERVAQAHKAVLALRGIAAPAAASPAQAPTQPKRRDVPVTLAGLPNAAPANTGDDVMDQFARLSGEDAELFLARQPASVVERLMRQADARAAVGG